MHRCLSTDPYPLSPALCSESRSIASAPPPLRMGLERASFQVYRLSTLERIALVELLPALDTASLHAHHVLPAILGSKVCHPSGFVNPRIPNHYVVEVIAHKPEKKLAATIRDDDGMPGAFDGGVDSVCFTGESDCRRLSLGFGSIKLVEVG